MTGLRFVRDFFWQFRASTPDPLFSLPASSVRCDLTVLPVGSAATEGQALAKAGFDLKLLPRNLSTLKILEFWGLISIDTAQIAGLQQRKDQDWVKIGVWVEDILLSITPVQRY